MDCPFCGKEMKEGVIPSGTKWIEKGTIDTWEAIPLYSGWVGNGPTAFLCPDCRQIVMPVPELEGMLDKVQRKMDEASEKLGVVQAKWKAQREDIRKQKKKEKFGQKDPWEL